MIRFLASFAARLGRLGRLTRLGLHILAGALTILLLFPLLTSAERERRVVAWARGLLAIVRVRVRVRGRPPAVRGEGALIVANHVSWLDIHVLHSLLPTRFVSKAEVRDWPLIGWMAARAGTLYLERAKKSDARRVNAEMARLLQAGECLALFPEGTTTDGTRLLPFYSSLFEPAVQAGARVWPAAIRYLTPDGGINRAAAYHDDVSLWQSLRRILAQDAILAEVSFLPPIAAAGLNRRQLAALAHQAIHAALAADGRDSQPETSARPRAAGP
ncbi:MAG: 1-acyl-sn-glycerol-3-phosphate acyltransferase [Thiobacillaceae bacterium]|nr:1-acyl-sn-glycerol-3-phosphate acyltransferase [Thiobacillaceae bacterium]MCX7672375.1 1-acyl-sn-glycerol-3-phosphate acyltransferase [Thiobacillaceae bacterium]MDW8324555.1 lysophospholipid acyltransferase family protein [Burkholderiales bacterium]